MGRKLVIATAVLLALTGTAFFEQALASPQDVAEEKTKVAPDVKQGIATFRAQCATCHGEFGKGDGFAAAALDPQPRDLSDAKYMAKITNDYLVKILKGGGPAVGKSPLMPALCAAMPEDELTNLIAYIRTLSANTGKPVEEKTEQAAK